MDAIEWHGRRQNLEIAGTSLKDGKNTDKLVAEVAKMKFRPPSNVNVEVVLLTWLLIKFQPPIDFSS